MNRAASRTAGLTLIEVLIAISLVGVAVSAVVPLMTTSVVNNQTSRVRTQAMSAAETWLDRYRAGREPTEEVTGRCVPQGTAITCTYPKGHDYATDVLIASHLADASSMNERLAPFQTVITATPVDRATSSTLWEVVVTVRDESRGVHAKLGTRFTR